ncbi:MAG: FAD-dependent oxidoreductase [Bacteriovoracaceae bacterium]
MSRSIAIVGAGISGLVLAKELVSRGHKVKIYEKSRGLGGRVASWRMSGSQINLGVQHFEASHPILKNLAKDAVKQGILVEQGDIYYPTRGINEWPKLLSVNLDIQREALVEKLSVNSDGCEVIGKNFETKSYDQVILAQPAPQAAELLKKSNIDFPELNSVEYLAEILFFYKLKHQEGLIDLSDFEEVNREGEIHSAKLKQNLVPHFLDLDKNQIAEHFKETLNLDNLCEEFHFHKWKYSRVKKTILPELQLKLSSKNIFLVGDYFFGDDLNAAVASVVNVLDTIGMMF